MSTRSVGDSYDKRGELQFYLKLVDDHQTVDVKPVSLAMVFGRLEEARTELPVGSWEWCLSFMVQLHNERYLTRSSLGGGVTMFRPGGIKKLANCLALFFEKSHPSSPPKK